jgi:hypothetical protein
VDLLNDAVELDTGGVELNTTAVEFKLIWKL